MMLMEMVKVNMMIFCAATNNEEPGKMGDEEAHSRECDFSVAIMESIKVDSEENGNGQEQQSIPLPDSGYYKIVGDNIDKNIRPSFQ